MTNIFEQAITERPEIPARFGEDGGKFYHYYDQLADELDEDLTKRLKSQLDSLLIFAGLFAGVNSAFLALTLPMMSADPANDTNALLLQLVKGRNATINSEADLPSATFSPPSAIYPVNILFAVSLTCALMSSFLAVLGQQWLVYYRKRSGGGAEHQRKEQLRRQLGAQRWRLELVLDDILPGLLQVGLVIFCISFILYLRTLSGSMSYAVSAVVGTALAILVAAAVCATWDRMCPYQSPLSHLLCWTMDRPEQFIVALAWLSIFVKSFLHEILWARTCRALRHTDSGESGGPNESPRRNGESREKSWESAHRITSSGLTWLGRREETPEDLIVASVKRVMLTSEHTAALIHAATNICAIDDEHALRQLLSDAEFFDRLHGLFSTFRRAGINSPPQLKAVPRAATKAFAAAILHLALTFGTIMDLVHPESRALAVKNPTHVQPVLSGLETEYLLTLARNVMLEDHLWAGELEHVSYLRLLAILLDRLFYGSRVGFPREALRGVIDVLKRLTASRQLLRTLTCTVHLYVLSRDWNPLPLDRGARERLPHLFEIVKTAYRSRRDPTSVPFLSEALQLPSWDSDNREQFDGYKIRLELFRHACQHNYLTPPGLFAPLGCVVRNIELDIRHPGITKQHRTALRKLKDQYVWILLQKLPDDPGLFYGSDLGESLAETLRYIREVVAPQEPGQPENRVTVKLFKLLLMSMQEHLHPNGFRSFYDEHDRFEAWINMGGCAK
ncbi:hypothetical protein FRC01_007515, partial [Tulasnella sp. 417]